MTARRKARQVAKCSREWVEHFRANEKPEALPREGPRSRRRRGTPWSPLYVRRGGLDFRSYWRRCWEEFEAAAEMMDPESYALSAHGQGSLSPRRVPDDGPDL